MDLSSLIRTFEQLGFPGADEDDHPAPAVMTAAKAAVSSSLTSPEFLADCIELELQRLERVGAWRGGLEPFARIPRLGIRFAFGYWRPGVTTGPHEHTSWTITGVYRNTLEVVTYDYDESYRRQRPVEKNRFVAQAGRVGSIDRHGIHAPRNGSTSWTMSFHVISPRDGLRPRAYPAPVPGLERVSELNTVSTSGDRSGAAYHRVRDLCLRAVICEQLRDAVGELASSRATALASRCRALGAPRTGGGAAADDTRHLLRRAHADLTLSWRRDRDQVVLEMLTPSGKTSVLELDRRARQAMSFVSTADLFDPSSLPGLTGAERDVFADALVMRGLFERV